MRTSADRGDLPLMGRRVLVTGATGFLGSHLVKRLVEAGSSTIAMIRPSSNLWRIRDVLDRIELVDGDLSCMELAELEASLSDVQLVFHVAAAGVDRSYQDAAAIVQTNVLGTLRLLQLAQTLRVQRFVYCGSSLEYGPGLVLSEDVIPAPTSVYGASKSAGWMLVQGFFHGCGLPVVSLRPFNVFGPLEAANKLIPHAVIKALENAPIDLTGGEQTRDFVYVDDVVDAFLIAAVVPEAVGSTFNICTGVAISVKDVVESIVELTGSAITPRFGVLPYRDTEPRTLSGDPSRAKRMLGWAARTSLRDGLRKTIQWFQEHRARYPVYAAG